MVKHVVSWKLKDLSSAPELKKGLEDLMGKIPGLLSIEVGININSSPSASDLVLISTHSDRDALDHYQEDPIHLAIKAKIIDACSSVTVVDFNS